MLASKAKPNMKKNSHYRVAVIGCGVFGAEIASNISDIGMSVCVLEARDDILLGASANNQNRLHLGFHYPRDVETGRQSIRGFERFKNKYSDAIQGGFPNAYFISDENSHTSPDDYIRFCQELGVSYKRLDVDEFPIQVLGSNMGILCNEVVYDCTVLRRLVRDSLRRRDIIVRLNTLVCGVKKVGATYLIELNDHSVVSADVVVNATYADINQLTELLGYSIPEWQYEYTAVPIIEFDVPRVGVTVMDGPFMTLLPYGKSGDFLLYHVVHSVIARETGAQINRSWLTREEAPFSSVDRSRFFEEMLDACQKYIPALRKARLKGFLEGPRLVMPNRESTDARPSIINAFDDTYFTIMAGKIDHCIWVAEDLARLVSRRLHT